ncbi:hypothetical protein HBI60_118260 [Parastagonospora nodorum]|nr:hypothetical protein HBI60_118260 [Parastagonospora nodorum]
MLNSASLLRLLTGNLLGNADCVNNNNNNVALTLQFSLTALLNLRLLASKRPALSGSDLNCRRTNPTIAYTVPYSDLKKYLSNSTENLTDIQRKQASESPLGLLFLGLIKLIPGELGSIYVLQIISKLNKVPTRELSSYIKTELYLHQKQALYFMLRDNSCKFYRLVITGEDTHCKQTIKKAYIMLLERALLILFIT